ncbi:nucleotidyltransferase domain-containing protein [Leptospira semungkisensis]|uniref:Nucleotidyltransferase domain-containing protein n=1 Tax=Leptospira semungkisensis TaxID=2484985 RepID=A0A4R9FYR4_9LEPT|nr:nucleotidyltransferase domain-containing protein [Leptospira semungkisensis]TGK04021.1 nucleotidyltransferase domain-containing protein [Leptospira semungkisensis]
MQKINQFIDKVKEFALKREEVQGVGVGGSYLSKDLDEYSDIDFVIVLRDGIRYERQQMVDFASNFGQLLSAFTGEHVGESRLLICLYEAPFLHVDFKFVQLTEMKDRVEDPFFVYKNSAELSQILETTKAKWPNPDFQWIEDRFWVWVHYATAKLGRGEYFEAIDFLSFIRSIVLGPMLHLKNKSLPRGVRKLEFILDASDLEKLKSTVPKYDFISIKESIMNVAKLYRELREDLSEFKVREFSKAENFAIEYLSKIAN